MITGLKSVPLEKSEGSSKSDYDSSLWMFNPTFNKDVVDEEDDDTTHGVAHDATVEDVVIEEGDRAEEAE